MAPGPLLAGIELGGTKSIALLARGRTILEQVTIETTTPGRTLSALADAVRQWRPQSPAALGVASFGPIDLARGVMLETPKPGWSGAAVAAPLEGLVDGPMAIHTDVTAAALAEGRWGAALGLTDYLYMTIGTGVGVGVVAGGRPVSGVLHPEAGHLRVRRLPDDAFPGACPFHGDCLEGLVSGPAIAARAGAPAGALAPDHPAWGPVADALAEAVATLALVTMPARILVGGGVAIGQPHLIDRARPLVAHKIAQYLPHLTDDRIADFLVPAGLGAQAGPLGAIALAAAVAEQALQGHDARQPSV
jgi:fructokinase